MLVKDVDPFFSESEGKKQGKEAIVNWNKIMKNKNVKNEYDTLTNNAVSRCRKWWKLCSTLQPFLVKYRYFLNKYRT